MSYNSDINDVIREAEIQGWRHQVTEKGHHQFYAPNGKDIVVVSGTAYDGPSWHNFMAQMKRAGYRTGIATLGDAMPAELRNTASTNGLSTSQLIIDLLTRHPNGMAAADIVAYMRSARSQVSPSGVRQSLSVLADRGRIARHAHGFYMLPRAPSASPAPVRVQAITPSPPVESVKSIAHAAGQSSGDPQIDKDLAVLDAALASLAELEGVVRRNREVLHQLAQLKGALGKIGG